jgi:hypothetical protein
MAYAVQRSLPNTIFSLYRFLKENQYTVGAETGSPQTKTLQQFYTDLVIFPAYPDDLTRLTTPVLAIGGLETARDLFEGRALQEPDFFGGAIFGTTYRIPLYGFVVGQGSDRANKHYRDRLMGDLYEIFVGQCGDEGLDLYDADTKTLQQGGGLEITTARTRYLPVNAPEIEAERYKFLVDIDVHYA